MRIIVTITAFLASSLAFAQWEECERIGYSKEDLEKAELHCWYDPGPTNGVGRRDAFLLRNDVRKYSIVLSRRHGFNDWPTSMDTCIKAFDKAFCEPAGPLQYHCSIDDVSDSRFSIEAIARNGKSLLVWHTEAAAEAAGESIEWWFDLSHNNGVVECRHNP